MFDLRTLCLLAGLACVIASIALGHAREVHRPSRSAVSLLGWSLACGGATMLATAGTGWAPARPGHWLSQLLGACAFAMLMESVRRLYARESRMQVIVGSLGFLAVMLGLAPGLRVTASVGVVFEAVCLGVALLTAATGIGTETTRARRVLMAVLSAALAIECVRLLVLWSPAAVDPAAAAAVAADPLAADEAAVALSDTLAAALFMLLPMMLLAVTTAIIWTRRLAQTLDHVWDDEVTGAATRKFLFAVGEPWLVANERQQSHTAVLMIDVDYLKTINAEHGHATGDRVLRHVASVLRRSLRSDSLITRFGDAEFCALVPVDDLAQAQVVSQRLCRVVEAARFHDDELSLTVTVSIGATMYEGGQSLEEVLRIVENRAAAAKADGHNCVVAEDQPEPARSETA